MAEMTPIRRDEAYRRLGVTERDTRRAPQITPQLRAISKTIRRSDQPNVTERIQRPGGHAAPVIVERTVHAAPYGPGADIAAAWPHYLHAAESKDASAVLDAYYSIPKTFASLLPIEAFCLAASVSPLRILETITGTIVRLGAQASTIIAAVNHPRVVEKSVEMALTDEGIEDRTLLAKAVGFLPTPKGSHVIVNANAHAEATAQSASVAAPAPENTIRRLVDRLNEARGILPTGAQPALSAHEVPLSDQLTHTHDSREEHTLEIPLDYVDDNDEESD
jgi:hypothetical protein